MNKHINKTILFMLVALIVVSASLIVMNTMRDSVAVEKAKEAYTLYMQENPASKDSDFIYIYEEHIVIAIRDGKVLRKEYVSEAHAVKAATGNSKVLHYSLSSTGDNRLFIVKVFDKQSDIFALGSQKLAAGADSLIIKVVSNGMIFANFEIPAAAIADKNSPVEVTISKIDPKENVKLGDNQEGFAYDIDVTNLVENNTSLIKVSMSGPKGLVSGTKSEAISVYHKSSAIASTYDAKTGEVAFETTDFSPYTFVYNMITVNTVDELRYYLQREGSGNIRLGQDITINMDPITDDEGKEIVKAYRDTTGQDAAGKVVSYKDDKGYTVYYARGFYNNKWMYFGALIIGDKVIDLNGHKITYTSSKSSNDVGLFVVNNNSSLTIIDGSRTSEKEGTGKIVVPYDQYAVWSVNPTSTANIYDGIFMTDEYAVAGQTSSDAALLYSSGGKINVYGGYYMYNPQYKSGGFNVVNNINEPRIWIYEGVHLSNSAFRDPYDEDSIVLVGGAELSKEATAVRELMAESKLVIKNWYEVNGRQLEVGATLNNYKYLYRVGNTNAFTLGTFFNQVATDFSGTVSIRVIDIVATKEHNANAENTINPETGKKYDKSDISSGYYEYIGDQTTSYYTFTANNTDWTKSTVQFANTFTGPVRLELCSKDLSVVYASINLEVVPGKNVTVVDELDSTQNNVLLNDIELTSSVTGFSISSGKSLYGNGFTINFAGFGDKAKQNFGVIKLDGGTLDNVRIIGDKYATAVDAWDSEGYAAAVYVTKESYIYNSYISGCQMPVRMNGSSLVLENTTLEGGRYCNMTIRGGEVTLNNVTTIQKKEVIDGKNCLGFGIFVEEAAPAGTKIKVIGDLTQYNWIARNETDYLPDSASNYVVTAFLCNQYVYTYNDTKYINSGIISISSEVLSASIETPAGYSGLDVEGAACVVTVDKNIKPSCIENGIPVYAGWSPSHQGAIKPTFAEASRKEYTNGSFVISFNDGETYTFDPNFLAATKFGKELTVHVTMSGGDNPGDYTGKEITFKEAGNYTLIYTLTDPYNYYGSDAVAINIPYKFTVSVEVTVITDNTKHAEFTFNGAAANVEEINGKWYAWPSSGVAVTVGNKTIYAATVDIQYYDNSSDFYCYAPVFTAVNIADRVGGVKDGAPETYDKDTTTMPDASKFNYVPGNTDNKLDPNSPYLNGSSSVHGTETYSSYGLCYKSLKGSNIGASTQLVQYWYKDNAGRTYYYYIQYKFAKHDKPSCLTADTLITMADGTQKMAQDLVVGDMVLVFNHVSGKMEAMPIIFNNHADQEAAEYEVLHLQFSNSEEVKIVSSHGFFDMTLLQYVYITNDNYKDYIGHEFYHMDANGNASSVTLTNAFIETEVTRIFCPVTYFHMNSFANGFLNTPNIPGDITGLVNYFEYDPDLKYNEEKMQADIEKYGLYTYEDFSDYISEAAYHSSPSVYLKVAVGKGMITYDEILDVIYYLLAGNLIQ